MKESFTRVFLELVKFGLWGNGILDIRIEGATDWQEVYRLATEQSVLGLVLAGLEHSDMKPPQVLLLQWIGEVQMIEQRNKEMNVFVAELIEKLRKEDIYAILVKGQGVAQYYEKPLWRCSGDVDLFLSESNYERAKLLLQPMASHVDDEGISAKHLGMTIDGFVVELHGTLHGGLSSKVDKELDDVLNDTFHGGNVRSWNNNGVQIFLHGPENDAFYVFTHILQHFYKEGLGLRQICDWCRLLYTYKDSLDKDLLELRIKRAGLMTEWRTFAAMAVGYLGMPVDAMPFYSDSAKWKKKAKKILDFVLEVGNFGHNRDSNYMKYPYVIRKCFSMGRRIGDLINHARIFPLDSLRFFPRIMFNGILSTLRGE
ncbi:MAG: nucleotidyltransferase family protein [Aeriscardovia sp.]|nr:nucleotidyltransferase family protein [Aeriscardovia sp.]